MIQTQRKLNPNYFYYGRLIPRQFKVGGLSRILAIPVELTKEQHTRIKEFYGLRSLKKWENSSVFDKAVEGIFERTINQQVRLAKTYFREHTDKWVHMVEPIKVEDKQIQLYLSIVKLQGE